MTGKIGENFDADDDDVVVDEDDVVVDVEAVDVEVSDDDDVVLEPTEVTVEEGRRILAAKLGERVKGVGGSGTSPDAGRVRTGDESS